MAKIDKSEKVGNPLSREEFTQIDYMLSRVGSDVPSEYMDCFVKALQDYQVDQARKEGKPDSEIPGSKESPRMPYDMGKHMSDHTEIFVRQALQAKSDDEFLTMLCAFPTEHYEYVSDCLGHPPKAEIPSAKTVTPKEMDVYFDSLYDLACEDATEWQFEENLWYGSQRI